MQPIYEKFNAVVRLVAQHPQLCLKFTTGDFLTGIGDISAFDKHELSMIAKGRPKLFVKAKPVEINV